MCWPTCRISGISCVDLRPCSRIRAWRCSSFRTCCAWRELASPATYRSFQARADRIKNNLLAFLIGIQASGKKLAGFGAAAKANTLLNYAGIRADLVPYVVDDTPSKQGKLMPGSRIPVRANFAEPRDYVLVFPWN